MEKAEDEVNNENSPDKKKVDKKDKKGDMEAKEDEMTDSDEEYTPEERDQLIDA